MRKAFLLSTIALALFAGGALAAHGMSSAVDRANLPFVTVSGVGIEFTGPAPSPSGAAACTARWNGPRNAIVRKQATHTSSKLRGAFLRTGQRGDYWDATGRCLVYVVAQLQRGLQATVFVETKKGVFARIGYASQLRTPIESRISTNGIISVR